MTITPNIRKRAARLKSPFTALFAILSFAFFTTTICAQTASLRGQVTDQNGAIVVGAMVTAHGPNGQVKTVELAQSCGVTGVSVNEVGIRVVGSRTFGCRWLWFFGVSKQPAIRVANAANFLGVAVRKEIVVHKTSTRVSSQQMLIRRRRLAYTSRLWAVAECEREPCFALPSQLTSSNKS